MTERIIDPTADASRDQGVPPLDDGQFLLADALDGRIAALTEWLEDNAPGSAPGSREELASLDAELHELVFWHHGYLAALRSVQSFIRRRRRALN
jgi:hypothetical protein